MPWADQLPNGNWRACWRDAAGRARSASRDPDTGDVMGRKKHAERVAGNLELAARRGEKLNRGRVMTWAAWHDVWIASRSVEPSTEAGDKLRIGKYLAPQWDGWRLNRITRSDVQAWVNDLSRSELAAGSVEKIMRLFSASMTAAVLDERLPLAVNPCTGVKLPRVAPGHERYLTRGEVEAIAYHLNEPYRTAVYLAAGTGLRWGELAGLHWQRVDLGERAVDVVETWDRDAGRIKTYPKGHYRRGVPIGNWLHPVLAEARHRARQGWREVSQWPRHQTVTTRCVERAELRPPPMGHRLRAGRRRRGPPARPAAHVRVVARAGRCAVAGGAAAARPRLDRHHAAVLPPRCQPERTGSRRVGLALVMTPRPTLVPLI
jgi:integrase